MKKKIILLILAITSLAGSSMQALWFGVDGFGVGIGRRYGYGYGPYRGGFYGRGYGYPSYWGWGPYRSLGGSRVYRSYPVYSSTYDYDYDDAYWSPSYRRWSGPYRYTRSTSPVYSSSYDYDDDDDFDFAFE